MSILIETFDAVKAREFADNLYLDELHDILTDIKLRAEKGEHVLHIYVTLKNKTVDSLEEKGFKVTKAPSISHQKDDLYYTISW